MAFAAHCWNKNSNFAWAFDKWFLNLFPRPEPFVFNEGGYATLSFIPTLGTMILGLIASRVLRGDASAWSKMRWLAIAGVVLLGGRMAAGRGRICPVVKRIWTPSWVLFSGGWCFLFLAGFYTLIDVAARRPFLRLLQRAWAFPLIVVGANSIMAYCMAHQFPKFIGESLKTHFGAATAWLVQALERANNGPINAFGSEYQPLFLGAAVLFVEWLILFYMYRKKIYLKI